MSNRVTDEGLLRFGKEIVKAAEMLQIATLSLRSLYVVNSSSVDSFVKLRQKITNYAKVYSEKVLPTSNDLIRTINKFCGLYDFCKFYQFKVYFEVFTEEAKRIAKTCNLTLKSYKRILVEFKNIECEVIEVLNQLNLKTKEYEQKKNKLMKSADVKFSWAIGLALVPVVNVIAGPILYMKGSKSAEESIAESEEELLTVAAAEAIKGPLIMSITNLVDNFNNIAEFFIALNNDLANIRDDDKLKTIHYDRMKDKSPSIIEACQHYLSIIPDAITNLKAIPDDCDKNYVEEWFSEL